MSNALHASPGIHKGPHSQYNMRLQPCFIDIGNFMCLVVMSNVMLSDLVHGDFCYASIVRVVGYNSSAQLAGDSRNMLYRGSVKGPALSVAHSC